MLLARAEARGRRCPNPSIAPAATAVHLHRTWPRGVQMTEDLTPFTIEVADEALATCG